MLYNSIVDKIGYQFFISDTRAKIKNISINNVTQNVVNSEPFYIDINENAEDGNTTISLTALVKDDSTVISSYVEDGTVTIMTQLLGDVSGDNVVDINDALRLFQYSMIPDIYPISYVGSVDFNKDGAVDIKDALRLFQYSMIPDIYPIS